MKIGKINLWKIALGLVILAVLVYKINLSSLIDAFSKLNFWYLLVAWVLLIFLIIIGALNVRILMKSIGISINFLKFLKYYFLSWSFGLIVPGKLGEFSLIYFLKNEKIDRGKSAATLIIDQLITLIVLFLFALLGVLLFFDYSISIKIALIMLLSVSFIFFLFFSKAGRFLIKKILGKYSKKFKGFSKTISFYIKKRKKILFVNFMLTIFKWVVNTFLIYVLFAAYNQKISFLAIIPIEAVIAVANLLPITIAGLGIRESLAVGLYSLYGISSSITLAAYIVLLPIKYITALIIVIFSFKKKELRKENF